MKLTDVKLGSITLNEYVQIRHNTIAELEDEIKELNVLADQWKISDRIFYQKCRSLLDKKGKELYEWQSGKKAERAVMYNSGFFNNERRLLWSI